AGGGTWRGWETALALGTRTAGGHVVLLTFQVPWLGFDRRQAFGFHVTDPSAPPPPPPPPPGPPPVDSVTTLVQQIDVLPANPQLGDPVSVHFRGRYPFDCGFISSLSDTDTANLKLILAPRPGCGDTTRVWEATFALGTPSAGDHFGLLHIRVPAIGLERDQGFRYHVTDPNAPPPPPPPPGDSLNAGLSASVPNPFSGSTTFAVS